MRTEDEVMTVAAARPEAPEVSVVIPTRNRARLARRAVASALAQSGVAVEVLVVDDGSREPFRPPPDPRVTILRNASSRGVAAARNMGLDAASAPWVALLDDDDYWAPEKLSTQLDAARIAGAGFAYCSALVVAGGRALSIAEAIPPEDLIAGLRRMNLVPAGASNVLISTAAVRKAGGFDIRLKHLADWDLWSRVLQSTRAASCPEALVAYVQHPASMHVAEQASVHEEARLLRELHRDGPITDFDHGVFALFLADGHRQAGRHWRAAAVQGRAGVRHLRPAYLRGAAAGLARATGLYGRAPRVRPETPDWVRRQWACAAP